jgi:hypothetical protein
VSHPDVCWTHVAVPTFKSSSFTAVPPSGAAPTDVVYESHRVIR